MKTEKKSTENIVPGNFHFHAKGRIIGKSTA